MKTFTKTIAILLMMLLAVSCSKEEIQPPMEEELSEDVLKGATVIPDICLAGTSNFDVYATKMNEPITTGEENFLLMYATLSYNEETHMYKLHTKEWMPQMDLEGNLILDEDDNPIPDFMIREVEFDIKITPGGAVKFYWPQSWWMIFGTAPNVVEQIFNHTGFSIKGPGINKETIMYTGFFDGETFHVNSHFTGMQIAPTSLPPYNVDVTGPAKFNFSMTLTPADCEVFPENS